MNGILRRKFRFGPIVVAILLGLVSRKQQDAIIVITSHVHSFILFIICFYLSLSLFLSCSPSLCLTLPLFRSLSLPPSSSFIAIVDCSALCSGEVMHKCAKKEATETASIVQNYAIYYQCYHNIISVRLILCASYYYHCVVQMH